MRRYFLPLNPLLKHEEGGSNEINLEEEDFLTQNIYTLITAPTKKSLL